MMKNALSRWCLCFGVLFSAAVWAQTSPDAMVKSTVDDVLSVLRQNKDPKELRQLAEVKVLPHFDFERMTQLAVGRPWQNANATQREALVSGFRTMLVNTYTAALGNGVKPADKIDVKAPTGGGDDVLVKTIAHRSGKEPVTVDYRIAKADAQWKVYDVVVEGVSLVQTYRSTFSSEIAKSGVDGLIKVMEQRNAGSKPS